MRFRFPERFFLRRSSWPIVLGGSS
jgi:hypothetical protein